MLDRRLTATGLDSSGKPPDRQRMAVGGSVRVEHTRNLAKPTQRPVPTPRLNSTQPE